MAFLNRSNILDPFQTGFRKFHSTQSALLKLIDNIRIGKEKKLAILLLQFDFSKTFDAISPSKLLQKLRNLGFSKSALQWFWLHLSGRSQCVFSQSSTSDICETNLGVLSPWLPFILPLHQPPPGIPRQEKHIKTALCRRPADIRSDTNSSNPLGNQPVIRVSSNSSSVG